MSQTHHPLRQESIPTSPLKSGGSPPPPIETHTARTTPPTTHNPTPHPYDKTQNPRASLLPAWTSLLPLPPGLSARFRRWLFRYIETSYKPSNPHEDLLAAQLAQALARKHLSALREPSEPSSLWLRYENLADRLLRQAQRDWQNHQKSKPNTHTQRGASPPPSFAPSPPVYHRNPPPLTDISTHPATTHNPTPPHAATAPYTPPHPQAPTPHNPSFKDPEPTPSKNHTSKLNQIPLPPPATPPFRHNPDNQALAHHARNPQRQATTPAEPQHALCTTPHPDPHPAPPPRHPETSLTT